MIARVEALARKMMGMPDLDRSTWIPGVNWVPKVGDAGRVTFYRGRSAVASFTIKAGGYVVTEDGKWFFLWSTGLSIADFTPGVQPLILRLACAATYGPSRSTGLRIHICSTARRRTHRLTDGVTAPWNYSWSFTYNIAPIRRPSSRWRASSNAPLQAGVDVIMP